MLGTIVNSISIIVGGIIGVFIKKGIKKSYTTTIMDGLGLTILVIGIMGAIKSENIILVIGSIVLGAIIGEFIGIEKRLDNLGNSLQDKLGSKDSDFSKAFVTASLIYCVGAMAIIGSLEAGIQGNYDTLFAKSILDGITAIIFASTLGIGVAFSSIAVFLYQATITLLANSAKDLLIPEVIREMSAVGGILIMAIGINILEIRKIKVGNLLPAVFIPIIYHIFANIIKIVR